MSSIVGFDSCWTVVLCGKFLKVYRLITEQKAVEGTVGQLGVGGMGREEVTILRNLQQDPVNGPLNLSI